MGTNAMDIVIFFIIGISVFLGFRKGFLKTVTGFLAIVLSLALACFFQQPVAEYLKNTPVYSTVYENTYGLIEVPEEETARLSDYGTGKLNLPREILDGMQKGIDTAEDSVADAVSETVANLALNICSILLVFLGVRLLLLLITSLAGILSRLPVIGWGDGLLGALFGLLRGILITYIILALATFAATMSPGGGIAKAIKQSEFAKVMYHHNFLIDFADKNEFLFDNGEK